MVAAVPAPVAGQLKLTPPVVEDAVSTAESPGQIETGFAIAETLGSGFAKMVMNVSAEQDPFETFTEYVLFPGAGGFTVIEAEVCPPGFQR